MPESPAPMAEEAGPHDRASAIARRMRMLTGVREEFLAQVPSERTRYTALAAVMVCTASVGGFSMFFALSEILGKPEPWFVPLAVFWSTFILCVDCWLVSSTAGSRWRTRVSVLLPRLAIATVFGLVIAEPLVLRVFQTGIVSQVRQERQTTIDNLRTALVDCNPVPGITENQRPAHGCAGMILSISNPAAASLKQLDALQSQESNLQNEVNTETGQAGQLEDTVNNECNGHSGAGLTGIVGNGPACKQDQQDVNEYLASHPIGAQNTQLGNLNSQIKSLQATLSGQQAGYRKAIASAISARLNHETPPSAPIGMAERFQALAYLSLTNGFIGVASWFVRIFFILIDCLPVLVKFIGGSTPYDKLIDIEISSAEKRFKRASETRDSIADEGNITVLHKARTEAAWRRREIDLEIMRRDARQESDKEDAIDELWYQKLKDWHSSQAADDEPADNENQTTDSSDDESNQTIRA